MKGRYCIYLIIPLPVIACIYSQALSLGTEQIQTSAENTATLTSVMYSSGSLPSERISLHYRECNAANLRTKTEGFKDSTCRRIISPIHFRSWMSNFYENPIYYLHKSTGERFSLDKEVFFK
jgi:hypothetical protein